MLSFPRSLLDSLNDDFVAYPMDYMIPRSIQQQQLNLTDLAVPTIKDNKFNLNLDLHHFDPSEISIKFDKNSLQVNGKREKKSDDGKHYEYREYVHHFHVPDNVEAEQLKCQLDQKGYLRIEAPVKNALEDTKRRIPIEFVKSASK